MERAMVRGGGGGCFAAVSKCIWGKPKEDLTRYRPSENNTIEFEDIVTAENRASATRAKKQVVTETERELLRTGKFDLLVEEQRRIDAERDAELRRQEEKLRQEEEAYYAAKREAAKRTTQQVTTEVERRPQPQPDVVIHHQPKATPTSLIATPPSQLPVLPTISQMLSSSPSPDEEDFDQFLESVKARQLSITSKEAPSVKGVSGEGVEGDEEEVDFGYWEKAELPPQNSPLAASSQSADTHTPTGPATSEAPPTAPPTAGNKDTALPARDMDLSLL